MAPDCVGPEVEAMAKELKPGEVLMLENTRFHKGEEKNDLELAKQMAALGDVYVNDAFGSAHRAHSSTEGIARFLPAVSGFLMEQELEYLGRAVANPEHPYIAILGGAKISDKIMVVETLLSKADKLIIGGGMANTFLAAKGYNMQDSLVEEASIETAKSILAKSGDKLILPVDAVIADKFDAEANTQVVDVDKIPAGWRMMDVGPKTLELYKEELERRQAHRLEWTGGRLRNAEVRRRDICPGETAGRIRRDDGDRRRRFCQRGQEGRRCQTDDARLHRRRRLARIPGRQGTARRGGVE